MSEDTPLSIHEPTRAPKGGIVVVQEAFGVNDHIEDVARRFAAEGWLAVAPHLFHRTGDPKLGYEDMSLVAEHFAALTPESVLHDIDAALSHVASAGIEPARTGVVGFCMGGTIALITTAERDVGAGVTFYGGGVTEGRFGFPPLLDVAPRLQAPWLGLFGDLDKGIPVAAVEELREAAARSGQETEIVRYAEAEHGFHCDLRASYHAASAKDAWKRTLAWFDRWLSTGGS
jgi:carboxymethylenebutenolidase